jgi:acyl-coenzyme A synthetase/AMP-(fatty) acid ligase
LNHPDVADAGVIGIPDDFSGEVPLAFIALNADASQRVKSNPREAERIKAALIKVAHSDHHKQSDFLPPATACCRCQNTV